MDSSVRPQYSSKVLELLKPPGGPWKTLKSADLRRSVREAHWGVWGAFPPSRIVLLLRLYMRSFPPSGTFGMRARTRDPQSFRNQREVMRTLCAFVSCFFGLSSLVSLPSSFCFFAVLFLFLPHARHRNASLQAFRTARHRNAQLQA